ncbi:hypothetical protein AOC36_08935 [Erysipelothrix larvae]|uniref:Uncharacterized protein n=2 Tax=Erysipelothrix larvae TaxID=1514105 RepID=A0A0X8H245_9FIRM|nr:hypothetical protein AOC36_08935 [Erysipelothrix larvae]
MNSKLKKQSVYAFNAGVARYEEIARQFGDLSNQLYSVRKGVVNVIRVIENQINLISNTPKSFHTDLQNINLEILSFKDKQGEIEKATLEVKAAKGGTGVGVTFSALGLAVATMGPSAAMSVATTFGVASTGTAISSLSGAAATNAALAWLGGGALSVGGGGMTSGAAFIALVGPVGFTIAGIMLTTSIGSGFFASQKNKEIAQKLNEERENLERVILKFEHLNQKISAILETTLNQVDGVIEASSRISKADFSLYSREEKLYAGILVNTTLTLAQLVNKELSLDD